MSVAKFLIVYGTAGVWYKLCTIVIDRQGSYYVTSPYHPIQKAFMAILTVDYSKREMSIPAADAVDCAEFNDEAGRLKLSHHPDGLVQFSGHGILSGRDFDGSIKGIGVQSWPLDRPVRGPAFSIVAHGITSFETLAATRTQIVRFSETELAPMVGPSFIVLESFYCPAFWRRFIRSDQNGHHMDIVHPNGAILRLKVLLPRENCIRQGFLGVALCAETKAEGPAPAFFMSGPTGNIRVVDGRKLGDGIFCMYPRQTPARRSLEWAPKTPPENGTLSRPF